MTVETFKPGTHPRDYLMYDYTNQAWVQKRRYLCCGHVFHVDQSCGCYGREHEGDRVETHSTTNCLGCMKHGAHVADDCHPETESCILA